MDKFIGKWSLEKNENLGDFLQYYGYNWIIIKAALLANVDAYFEETINPAVFKRTIDSTFIKGTEEYILDGAFRTTPANIDKKHSLVDGIIYTEVIRNGNNWSENIKINGDTLTMTRTWTIEGIESGCVQIFRKAPL